METLLSEKLETSPHFDYVCIEEELLCDLNSPEQELDDFNDFMSFLKKEAA